MSFIEIVFMLNDKAIVNKIEVWKNILDLSVSNKPAEEESLNDGGLAHEAVSHDDEAKPLLIRSQARDTTTVAAVCHSVFDSVDLQIRNVVK